MRSESGYYIYLKRDANSPDQYIHRWGLLNRLNEETLARMLEDMKMIFAEHTDSDAVDAMFDLPIPSYADDGWVISADRGDLADDCRQLRLKFYAMQEDVVRRQAWVATDAIDSLDRVVSDLPYECDDGYRGGHEFIFRKMTTELRKYADDWALRQYKNEIDATLQGQNLDDLEKHDKISKSCFYCTSRCKGLDGKWYCGFADVPICKVKFEPAGVFENGRLVDKPASQS